MHIWLEIACTSGTGANVVLLFHRRCGPYPGPTWQLRERAAQMSITRICSKCFLVLLRFESKKNHDNHDTTRD
jgi:hypothetical protein